MLSKQTIWMMLAAIAIGSCSTAMAEGSVVQDSSTGDYIVSYPAPDGTLTTMRFIPATKVEPSVRSSFKLDEAKTAVVYRYSITNGRDSKQNLVTAILSASGADDATLATPANWDGSVVATDDGGVLIGWSYWGEEDLGGLKPGSTLNGFRFDSRYLPGVGIIKFRGARPSLIFLDDGPDPDSDAGKKLHELEENDFVIRPTAVPRIRIPIPFEPTSVLVDLRSHITNDLRKMELVDPVFATRLDALLVSAIEASKRNDVKTLRDHLKTIRQALKKEHGDSDAEGGEGTEVEGSFERTPTISKLATKVLDFDVKYIEKRVKHGER